MSEIKRYLNTDELARYLGLSKWGIYDLVAERKIPFIKVSHKVLRFDRVVVDRWMKSKEVSTSHEYFGPQK